MIQSLLLIYDESAIVAKLKTLWEQKYSSDESAQAFVVTFYKYIPEEAIAWISNKYHTTGKIDIIQVLGNFESTEYDEQVLSLLFEILDNNLGQIETVSKVASILNSSYRYSNESVAVSFKSQKLLLKHLNDRMFKNGDSVYYDLFSGLAKELLGFRWDLTEDFIEIKKDIISSILEIAKSRKYSKKILGELFSNFGWRSPGKPDKKRIDYFQSEKRMILELIKNYPIEDVGDKIFIHKILLAVSGEDDSEYIAFTDILKTGDKIFTACCMMRGRISFELEADWNEREKSKELRITNAFKYLGNPNDGIKYFEEVYKDYFIDTWKATKEVDCFLNYIYEIHQDKFVDTLSDLLLKVPNLDMRPHNALNKTLEILSAFEVFNLVNKIEIINKDSWLMTLFLQIKKDQITEEIYNSCLEVIKRRYVLMQAKGSIWGDEQLRNLMDFEKYKAGFICSVFREFLEYVKIKESEMQKNDSQWSFRKNVVHTHWNFIEGLYKDKQFNEDDYSIENLEKLFGDEVESVLYEVYFYLTASSHISCTEEFISHLCNKDVNYMYRYYDAWAEHDNDYIDKKIINKFPNIAKNLLEITKRCIDRKKYWKYLFFNNYSFRNSIVDIVSDDIFEEYVKLFLAEYKTNEEIMRDLAGGLGNLNEVRQIICHKAMIEQNIPIENFEMHWLFLSNSWSGSFLPYVKRGIDVIEKLIALATDSKNKAYAKFYKDQKKKLEDMAERQQIAEYDDDMIV